MHSFLQAPNKVYSNDFMKVAIERCYGEDVNHSSNQPVHMYSAPQYWQCFLYFWFIRIISEGTMYKNKYKERTIMSDVEYNKI